MAARIKKVETTHTKKLKVSTGTSEIIREKVWVDNKKVNSACRHLNNKVNYALFKSDEDPAVVPENVRKRYPKAEVHGSVCFSGLLGFITGSKANRLYDTLEVMDPKSVPNNPEVLLKPEERSAWISLAKKYKMLPPYIDENAIIDLPPKKRVSSKAGCYENSTITAAIGNFVIDLVGLSPTVLYIYLSTLRNIREDPGLPRAVLHLVNELGMNFYAAYVFASKVVLDCTGHHVISVQRPYGMVKNVYDKKTNRYTTTPLDINTIGEEINIPLHVAIGLQRVVNNSPLTYDKREVGDVKARIGRFNCSDTIEGISKATRFTGFQELFDEDIIAAVMSKTDKEAKECIVRFDNKLGRIKYKEAAK